MRSLFIFVLLSFHSMALSAIETKPFSVREFKTRDIKFRNVFDREETSERTRPSRNSQAADDWHERRNAQRELQEYEREIQAQIRENERQQRELQQAKEREEIAEWKNYLSELRASNEQLRAEVKAKRGRDASPELYCGALLSDGSKCPNRSVEGKWFCAEHEDPPLPKSEMPDIRAEEKSESQNIEAATKTNKPQARPKKHKPPKRSLPERKDDHEAQADSPASSSYWIIALLLGSCIFVTAIVLTMRKGKATPSRGRYSQLSEQRKQQKQNSRGNCKTLLG